MRLNDNILTTQDILLACSNSNVKSFSRRILWVVASGSEDGKRAGEV